MRLALVALLAACGDDGAASPRVDAGAEDAGPERPDASTGEDAAGVADTGPAVDSGTGMYGDAVALGDVEVLVETSGIAASRAQPGVFWAHDDSGGGPVLHAIDGAARHLATFTLEGASARDYEDIAVTDGTPRDVIYVADVGDNAARESDGATGRTGVQLYRVPEPDVSGGDATVTPETIELRYPSRPYDCESVFVDHATGDVYLVTKEASPAEVFVARAPLVSAETRTLEHAGTIDFDTATAADASRDGTRFVVRGYGTIRVYTRTPGATPIDALVGASVEVASPSAAEAVCFEHDGWGLYTIAEGAGATLYYVPD